MFVVFLDAKNAFDKVVREILINRLYDCGISDHGLLLIDQRLKNRKTICEWDRTLFGPINDECGVEQGGKNSSDFFKVYNNAQIDLAQQSELGVVFGPITISSIGQADDVALLSNDQHALQALIDLSTYYCQKFHVTLAPGKTKLQLYDTPKMGIEIFCAKSTSNLKIGGQ